MSKQHLLQPVEDTSCLKALGEGWAVDLGILLQHLLHYF